MTKTIMWVHAAQFRTVAARGCLSPEANVFVAVPTLAIRSPIDILMVTTMALVRTVNSTLSWGCNYTVRNAMELSLISYNCQCKRQFAGSGQISEFHIFASPNAAPAQCPLPFAPPPSAATGFAEPLMRCMYSSSVVFKTCLTLWTCKTPTIHLLLATL